MQARDRRIIDLVTARTVRTQADLVRVLRKAGLRVSQATVSRDVKRLGLVKVPVPGGARYLPRNGLEPRPAHADVQRLERAFQEYVTEVTEGSGLVLVKTVTGSAGTVAEAIDEVRWREVAGTVAGDNTILVIPRAPRDRGALRWRLRSLLSAG